MALIDYSTPPDWSQMFCRRVVSINRYWQKQLQSDIDRTLPEAPNIIKSVHFGLRLPEAWEPVRGITLQLGLVMIRQGQGAVWEGILRTCISLSAAAKEPTEIEFRRHLGHLYRLQGKLAEARQLLAEALELCDAYASRIHYYGLLNDLALVARLAGQHDEAIAYCQQVFDAASNLSLAETAEAFNVMGFVAYDRRQWEDGQNYFTQALEIYRHQKATYHMARMLNNRGLVLLRSGQWTEAEQSFLEAIEKFETANDQIENFKSVMNLGNVYLMRKEYQAAIDQYNKALPVFQSSGYVIDAAYTLNNLGMAYAGLKLWSVAEPYFLNSVDLWQNLGDTYNLANTLDNMAVMFIEAEQPQQTRNYLEQALQVLGTNLQSLAHLHLRGVIKKRLDLISMYLA